MLRRLLDAIDVLLNPACWIQNERLSPTWDRELTWLLDNGYKFENVTTYHARIGEHTVWIENHPYASFTLDRRRPRRATVLRAGRALERVSRHGTRRWAHQAADAVDPVLRESTS